MGALKEKIDERLWNEVKNNYLNEQYSHAVLDAVQYIGDLIREMSGEDGDGVQLIGTVFNLEKPKIKINSLKTETEKNVQRGVMFLLKGFYQAIRNARVHEKKVDSEQEAIELILFINHILRIVDKSKGHFTVENTLKRVMDEHFVANEKYVDHILSEIPKLKYFDVAIELYRNRNKVENLKDVSLFWRKITEKLSAEDIEQINDEISENMRYAEQPKEVISVLSLIGDDWKHISEDSKLRAENLLIKKLPKYFSDDPNHGGLDFLYWDHAKTLSYLYKKDFLRLKSNLADKVFRIFENNDEDSVNFILQHFDSILIDLNKETGVYDLDTMVKKKMKFRDQRILEYVKTYYKDEKKKEFIDYYQKQESDADLPF